MRDNGRRPQSVSKTLTEPIWLNCRGKLETSWKLTRKKSIEYVVGWLEVASWVGIWFQPTNTCIFAYAYTCSYVWSMYTCVYIHIHVFIYKHTHTHRFKCTHTDTYKHTYICVRISYSYMWISMVQNTYLNWWLCVRMFSICVCVYVSYMHLYFIYACIFVL